MQIESTSSATVTESRLDSEPYMTFLFNKGLPAFIGELWGISLSKDNGSYRKLPNLEKELAAFIDYLNSADTNSSDYKYLEDNPVLAVDARSIAFAYEGKTSGGLARFSDEARDEVDHFVKDLQSQKTGDKWNTELVSVSYGGGYVVFTRHESVPKASPSFSGYVADANQKLTNLIWDTVEKSENSSWMAGMQDAVSAVETFAVIEGEQVEDFKKNLLIRLKDMLKPTYVTPAKYEPNQNRQMTEALTRIHTRLSNAQLKAIDSHAISLIIADCENALPDLVKG